MQVVGDYIFFPVKMMNKKTGMSFGIEKWPRRRPVVSCPGRGVPGIDKPEGRDSSEYHEF
jgi:hypothetical protein